MLYANNNERAWEKDRAHVIDQEKKKTFLTPFFLWMKIIHLHELSSSCNNNRMLSIKSFLRERFSEMKNHFSFTFTFLSFSFVYQHKKLNWNGWLLVQEIQSFSFTDMIPIMFPSSPPDFFHITSFMNSRRLTWLLDTCFKSSV